jgi:flagellin-like hook-associated protein FlgL
MPVSEEKKTITKISFVSDDILSLTIPKSFCSDTQSLGQAIQKTRRESSLLETIAEVVEIQSRILSRMRDLATQTSNGIVDNIERGKTIRSYFLELQELQEELSKTQNLLIRSVKTLNVTMENLSAANSTSRERNFTEKVAFLTKNQVHSIAHTAKKEYTKRNAS